MALAAGHKGIEVEWVDHDPDDRSAIERLSGQELVPVAELDGEVIVDSMRIVERLEELRPEPPLYPATPAAGPARSSSSSGSTRSGRGRRTRSPPATTIPALRERLAGWQQLFEDLLDGPDYLLGEFGAADVCAFPFLKYAVAEPDPADTDPFHAVLRELDAPPPPARVDRARRPPTPAPSRSARVGHGLGGDHLALVRGSPRVDQAEAAERVLDELEAFRDSLATCSTARRARSPW